MPMLVLLFGFVGGVTDVFAMQLTPGHLEEGLCLRVAAKYAPPGRKIVRACVRAYVRARMCVRACMTNATIRARVPDTGIMVSPGKRHAQNAARVIKGQMRTCNGNHDSFTVPKTRKCSTSLRQVSSDVSWRVWRDTMMS